MKIILKKAKKRRHYSRPTQKHKQKKGRGSYKRQKKIKYDSNKDVL